MANEALLHATSAGVVDDGSTFVVLRWELVDDAAGYNLYRRLSDGPDRWGKPINGTKPIAPPSNARELRALVAPDSPEWLALAHGLAAVDERALNRPVDPGEAFANGLSVRQTELVRAASRANRTMGEVAGLAYTDRGVIADKSYLYELRAVLENSEERVVATQVPVWAGHFLLPDPPSGLATQAGDCRALVLWNRNPYAATYVVERASTPGGPFVQVNPKPVAYDMDNGIDGEPLTAPQPGFLDIAAWDADGLPTSHVVAGVNIFGPNNGLTNWYRVASVDTLDRAGAWSAPVAATPVRTLPPMAPDELQVSANTSATGLVVTWRKVNRNVENHVLPDVSQTNTVYRATSREALEDLSTLSTCMVATIVVNPQDLTNPLVSWTDLDPALIPPYGSSPFFYRVRVTDPFGNVSAPSAVISGAVPDTRPPGPTTLVAVTGRPNSIRVEWQPNIEPDLAGYQIYRGVCDRGYIYVPGIVRIKNKDGNVVSRGESQYRCDMSLVGDLPVGEAKLRLAAEGVIWFEDFSVPEGSPLCYGYWVRAYDQASNLYAQPSGCPKEGEYRCGRLRETSPPPPPVMTGLRARNRGVLVEWISSPVQDLRAFHVYRSDKETDPPTFLACVFTDGTVSSTPWTGLKPSCADVPAVPDPLAARGSYLDGTAEPHHVYWYRVSGLDWLGNESEAAQLANIPASSTFAYTSDLPPTPSVSTPATPTAAGCGLVVSWTPAYDPTRLAGFVVFRSTVGGSFRQVSGILKENAFTDASARRGVDYLYCVQSIDLIGLLSQPSTPVSFRH
jgi:hypothetical protein